MSKFCPFCGTQLEDDQVCSCPQSQANAAQPQGAPPAGPGPAPQAPAAPSPVAAAFRNLVPFCRSYLRSPTAAVRAALDQKDLLLPIFLLAFQAIATGLVIYALLTKVCLTLKALLLQLMGLSSLYWGGSSSLFSGIAGPSISASFPLCLLFGILAAAIAIVVFVALIFAAAKLQKSTCTFQDAVIACGAHSPFVTTLLLLSFLLFFASIWVGLVLFVLAMLTWVILGVPTAQALTPDGEHGKFWMLYIAVVLVAVLIGGLSGVRFFGLSAGATKVSYAGQSFRVSQAISQFDLEDVVEDILSDLF
jgi:hypothetical protein